VSYRGLSWAIVSKVLIINTAQDLNRQVVKSDTGRVIFPAIAFEIPALAQRGQLNTVEGVLSRAIDGLSESQPIRRVRVYARRSWSRE